MKPKVSICIPAYNEPELLMVCLESIFTQTYKDYEIIITDDSPNEVVKNLLDKLAFKNKVKYIKNETRLGTPENWNEAVRHSSGIYIKMLHHDDKFNDKNSLFEFVNMLEKNPDSNFAFCASQKMSEDDKYLSIHEATEKQLNILKKNPNFLLFGNFIGAPSATIYKKDNMIEYDSKLRWLVDIDFYIRTLNSNSFFVYSKKPLIKILVDGKHQVTREFEKNLQLQKNELIYLHNKLKHMYGYSFNIKLYEILYFSKLQIKKILICIGIYRLLNDNKK